VAPPQSSNKKSPILLIVIGVVVVALIALLIFWAATRGDGGEDNTGGGASAGNRGVVATGTPEEAVQQYLDALAAGKSADALALAAVAPTNDTFISDAVLQAGLAVNPITDIKIDEDSEDSDHLGDYAYIGASYVVGTQRVSAHFSLEKFDGRWLLDEATTKADLSYVYEKGVGMSLNGISLDSVTTLSSVELLPGTYSFAVANPLLTVTDGQFVIEDPSDYPSVSSVDIELAADASPKLAAAATAKLDACLAEKDLATTCQFARGQLEGGAEPDLSTVAWTIKSGSSDFSGATFEYSSYSGTTSASASIDVELAVSVSDTAGDLYGGTEFLYGVTVDFSDPNALVATFE
jgi:hypothetical protein